MAPERITGQSYTITSDVWSLGVTLLEVAQHRFPFPADGTEMQPRAGLIDLLTYIVRQPIPKLKDEPENGIHWSDNFKYFIECWYVLFRNAPLIHRLTQLLAWKKNPLDARPPGGCWNILGYRKCQTRRSTWPTLSSRCGIGRSKRTKENSPNHTSSVPYCNFRSFEYERLDPIDLDVNTTQNLHDSIHCLLLCVFPPGPELAGTRHTHTLSIISKCSFPAPRIPATLHPLRSFTA
jgi:serine/threonine protein kinase